MCFIWSNNNNQWINRCTNVKIHRPRQHFIKSIFITRNQSFNIDARKKIEKKIHLCCIIFSPQLHQFIDSTIPKPPKIKIHTCCAHILPVEDIIHLIIFYVNSIVVCGFNFIFAIMKRRCAPRYNIQCRILSLMRRLILLYNCHRSTRWLKIIDQICLEKVSYRKKSANHVSSPKSHNPPKRVRRWSPTYLKWNEE